uniref:2-methoxy-6-polyprenyl-1,4-benzoquinol methylase, mitochondrial n=1 Tax=Polytomella parva TaxID=51329 RepID=A0A7S0VRP3_9CHLO
MSYSENSQPKHTIDFGFKEVPVDEKESLVRQVFSSVADKYDIMNDLMSAGLHRCWKDRLVQVLSPFSGMKHLDVAGGTGDVAMRVLRAVRTAELEDWGRASSSSNGEPGSVVVCDINAEMLEAGKRKWSLSDISEDQGLSWVQGNAEQLPFEDNTFDSYTITFGIRNVTNRDAALREALRVLKPGGRILILEFSQVKDPVLRQVYDLYSFNVIPAVGGLVAGDASSYQYLVESIRKFPDQETFAGMIRSAGFKWVTYENLLGGIVAMHSGFKLKA